MFAVLAQIQPLNLTTGARVLVSIGSSPGGGYGGVGGVVWEPAMTKRPQGSIDLMSINLSGGTEVASINFEINTAQLREVDVTGLYWPGAPLQVWRADDYAYGPATLEFNGIVKTAHRSLASDTLAVTGEVLTSPIEVDLLTALFNGDGAAGGDPSFAGTLKPAGFGRCLNIQPIWFDPINNIGCIDGYGNCQGIDWLAEGLSPFGPSAGDFANYDALKAAILNSIIKPGGWGTSIAQGLIGLGAPPAGIITANATFGANRVGAMMKRAILVHAGVDASVVDIAAFDALDGLINLPVHYWTASQRQVKDLNEALAASCNATPIVTFQGKLSVTLAQGGALIGTLNRFGYSEPAVTNWEEGDGIVPYWRIKGRAARPASVLSIDQVQYYDNLVPRGLYNAVTVYRQGNIVSLANKSEWLYINSTPSAGHAPPDPSPGDQWWSNRAPAPGADVLKYLDGTPIQTLKPEEPGAQVTRTLNTSQSALTFVLGPNGAPIDGQFPYTLRATVSKANFDDTANATFSIATTGGVSATIDNTSSTTRGQITVTNCTGAGTVTVTALSGNVVLTASITVATQGVLAGKSQIGTALIEAGAITKMAAISSTGDVAGAGSAPSTAINELGRYVITLTEPTTFLITIGANHSYSGSADFGAAVTLNGSDVAAVYAGAGVAQSGYSRSYAGTLPVGTNVIQHNWRGSAGVTVKAGANLIVYQFQR